MKDFIYICAIIILLIILLHRDLKPNKLDQDYKEKVDSIKTVVATREIIEKRIVNNVTTIIQHNEAQKNYYTSNDSVKLIFIDSILRANGYR